MTKIEYKTKAGVTQYRPDMSEAEYRDANNEYLGFCLACGNEQGGCEPDARQYECESCGAKKVYGIEELLMMGLVTIKGDDNE